MRRSELAQFRQQFLALRDCARIVYLGIAHDAILVEHIGCAFVHPAFVVEHAVGFTYGAMRPVIRQQREWNSAQLFGPGFETGNGVGADLQDLDIQFLEFFVVLTEPGYLIFSATGKRKWQE